MKGLLQNLAFGEKIIKMKNGFHLAVESVKITETIVNIIRSYYRDFLKGQGVDKEPDNESDDEEIDEESGDESGDESDDDSSTGKSVHAFSIDIFL